MSCLFPTVCDPVRFKMCTCSMSVPTQLCYTDSSSDSSSSNLTVNPPLAFQWSVLAYNTLINGTKKAVGLGDHCLTAVQGCMPALTPQQPERVLTLWEETFGLRWTSAILLYSWVLSTYRWTKGWKWRCRVSICKENTNSYLLALKYFVESFLVHKN